MNLYEDAKKSYSSVFQYNNDLFPFVNSFNTLLRAELFVTRAPMMWLSFHPHVMVTLFDVSSSLPFNPPPHHYLQTEVDYFLFFSVVYKESQ